jgi:hypothetical protein
VSDGTIAAAPVSEPHPAPRSVSGALATFHDANPAATPADFTVTIDWGDGGSPSTGTVTGARGDFIVSGTHTYSKSATYAIKVHVADAGGASADTTVSYAALNATTTKLACAPAAVRAGRFTTCTITVRDRAGAGAVTPTGTVTAKSTGAGVFHGVPCKLRATRASGRASCKFSYKPKAVGSGSQVITAIYRGDRAHARSSAKASLRVGRR